MARRAAIRIEGYEEFKRTKKEVNQAVHRAGQRAVRKVAAQAKTQWSRVIHAELNLKPSEIKEAIRIIQGKSMTVGAKIEVDSRNSVALSTGRRFRSIPIIKFVTNVTTKQVNITSKGHTRKQSLQQVRVKIKKKKGVKLFKGGFIADMVAGDFAMTNAERLAANPNANKHAGLFTRNDASRLPIGERYTTAVEDIARDKLPQIQDFASARLKEVFTSQLRYELKGIGMESMLDNM